MTPRGLEGADPKQFVVDPESSLPLYRQVRALLEDQLARGIFTANRPLPSTRYLSQALGVSRNTVALAYQELTSSGLVESRPRSGLYPVTMSPGDRTPRSVARPVTGCDVDWSARLAAQRELHKHLPVTRAPTFPNWRDYRYPFISAQPELRSFPVRGWQRASVEALQTLHLPYSVRDAGDFDDPLLVETLCNEILPPRGVSAQPDEVLVTSGAQQGLSLISDVLLSSKSVVAVENPGYVDMWRICSRVGASVVPVPTDHWGAEVDDAPRFDAIYLTPSHHHPTNVTLSLPRRRLLMDLLKQRDAFAIEDDYDSEFRFRGQPTPSLKSMDTSGRVLYLGSFSKFLSAGLRLGFVVAHRDVIAELRAERYHRCKHLPGHVQRALAIFISSGEYHRALRTQRRRLRASWETLTAAVRHHLPVAAGADAFPPGGVSLWYTAPSEIDCKRWALRAREQGVLVADGSRYFFPGTWRNNHLRIGFGSISTELIEPGIRALAAALRV
ncbi:PLP-dependent aminotransferase family protein [Mycobacterium sp.]|uniref:MocR-like pyridoxine biosynthesis transcription factor PdxR n=1 Tax=Mycobacterium sp. TaxID=1785 RepID=UPI003BA852C1